MSCVWYTRLLCRIWAGGRSGLNRLDRWRAVVCATRCEGDGVGGACVSHAHQYFTPESPSRRGTQLPFASCCLALCPQTQQQAPPRARLTTSILAPGYWRCMWCSPPQKPTHRRPGALTPPPPHSPPQVTSPTPPPPHPPPDSLTTSILASGYRACMWSYATCTFQALNPPSA